MDKELKDNKFEYHLKDVSEIYSYFTEDEIDLILKSEEKDNYENPLKHILDFKDDRFNFSSSNDRHDTIFQTNQAFKKIKNVDKVWLDSQKNKLLSDDYSQISSILGEIRAYGELIPLFNGNKLIAVPTTDEPTPDFRLLKKEFDGTEYTIDFEVYTRTPNEEGQRGKEIGNSTHIIKGTNKSINIKTSVHSPFSTETRSKHIGRHGSDLRHIIHLFTQIKKEDNQFNDKNINILWIDMQDETVSHFDYLFSDAFPTKILKGGFISSVLWHAFYGKKEMIILHEVFDGEYQNFQTSKLEHEGRFYLNNHKTDFVIINFPKKKIIYEKPDMQKKLPIGFRETLTHLLHFNSAESRLDIPYGILKNLLDNDYKNLDLLYKYLIKRDEE